MLQRCPIGLLILFALVMFLSGCGRDPTIVSLKEKDAVEAWDQMTDLESTDTKLLSYSLQEGGYFEDAKGKVRVIRAIRLLGKPPVRADRLYKIVDGQVVDVAENPARDSWRTAASQVQWHSTIKKKDE